MSKFVLWRNLKRVVLLYASVAGCAEVQRIPGEPVYQRRHVERTSYEPDVTSATLTIAVRKMAPASQGFTVPVSGAVATITTAVPVTAASMVTASATPAFALAFSSSVSASQTTAAVASAGMTGAVSAPVQRISAGLEGRFLEQTSCRRVVTEKAEGYREVKQVLSEQDEYVMWSAYGGAGLVALLTGIGMARGQDPGRGVLIFGLYGLPLAGAGAFQTWRSRTLVEPLEAEAVSKVETLVECPESTLVDVRFVTEREDAVTQSVGQAWRPLDLPVSGPDGDETATLFRAVLERGTLTAFLESPLAATAVTSATVADLCSALGQSDARIGWLPAQFFSQPTLSYPFYAGQTVDDLSVEQLGSPDHAWQVFALNPGIEDRIALAEHEFEVALPERPRSLGYWKAKLPKVCE